MYSTATLQMEVNEVNNATHDDEWCLGNYYLPNSNRLQDER
jgi:hypothetical protein